MIDRRGEDFPKSARLKKRSQFLTLAREGQRTHTPHFIVLSKVNGAEQNRLGITVTTRVGNAVVRNRIKRWVREFFRRERTAIAGARDFVVIAKKGAENLSLSEVAGEIRTALIHGKNRQR